VLFWAVVSVQLSTLLSCSFLLSILRVFLCFEQINDDDDDDAKIALIYAEVKYKVHIN